jgi:hypothetical protein
MRKLKKQTPAQILARTRNQHKGRISMTKGLIFWMLREPQRNSLTGTERTRLGTCLIELERILRSWQPII